MTRDHILGVVAKHLSNAVDDLEPATVEGARSMKEYGANSLDIVEVVSASMRELKIKVPRSQLNGLTNIDGLIDLLFATSQSTPAGS